MTINNISNLVGSLLLSELNKTNGELLKAFENLSTGRKINSASDDAAGLAIISRLESQVRGLAQAQENAQLGISKLNVADGYSESISNDLQRIRELSVQAANGTLNDSDRAAIQEEITQLRENIDFTASSAEFNSQKIFSGQAETFLVSPDGSGNVSITIPEVSSASLGLDQIDVSTRAGAEAAISRTDAALDSILEIRTNTGATQNRLESTINSLSRTEVDTLQSLSGIRDANIAEEVLKASAASTRLEAQLAVIAQVNKLNGSLVSQLLGES